MPSIANCYWLALPVIIAISCQAPKDQVSHLAIPEEDLSQYVNPFIGTGGHGHTFPGATMPFGMVQLSPDTRLDGWDGCSGYHYSDEYIYGFSHTHLSGTGVSDYGDILLMPTNKVEFNNGADGKPGYKAHFSHDSEKAEAGYYKVQLDDTDILVELTTTPRTGIHRYTFPPDQDQVIILDLEHRDKLISHGINRVSDTVVQGHRNSEAWARDQRLFYKLVLSHPVKEEYYNLKENPTKAAFVLDNPKNEPVVLRVSISAVDEEGAAQNLITEVAGKDFDQVWSDHRMVKCSIKRGLFVGI
jgi:predicted alpha-1,2-mannosidase